MSCEHHTEGDKIWWRVKVYHPASQTYTWLDMLAHSADDIEDELAAAVDSPNSWVFVCADPEENQ